MPPTDRLSALDAAFLALDGPGSPLHVGFTLRFAGPAPPLAQLRRHLEARLHLVPRFRRRVERPPLALGDPRWVDDPAFDIAHHVGRVRLDDPTGLRAVAGRLLSAPLDPRRPLWRLELVDGVGDGFALVGQAHHALIDGIAAIEVAMLLFGPAQEDGAPDWLPAAPPTLRGGARDALADRARQGLALARGPKAAPNVPDAARAVEALIRAVPRTSLDTPQGGRRAVAYAEVGLEDAKEAGRRHGATLNDVLLAATTLALARALRREGIDGAPPAGLKVLVPVSTRGDDAAGDLGNRISFMAVTLPLAEPDPVRVLRRLREQTKLAKAGGAAGPLDALARGADLLPAPALAVLARGAYKAAAFNAVVSNVPGPPVPLELLGRRLLSLHPAVPVAPGHVLSIGAVSYVDRLHVGLFADAEALPGVVDVGRDVERAFDALRIASAPMPAPWRARAIERRRAASAAAAKAAAQRAASR